MINTASNTACIYTQLDHNIHHVYFTESTRTATDEFFALLGDIYDEHAANPLPNGEKVRILFEMEKEYLPIMYSITSYRGWRTSRATHPLTRIAIISGSELLMPIVNSFIRNMRLGHLEAQFFKKANKDAAIEWLKG